MITLPLWKILTIIKKQFQSILSHYFFQVYFTYEVAKLFKEIKIPKDSRVFINSLGLLGEKYIEIMPGEDYTTLLAHGDSIRGVDPLSMFDIAGYTKDIADKLSKTAANINDTALNIKKISQDISDGKGTIGRFLKDESVYENFDAFVADLKSHPWKLLWRSK